MDTGILGFALAAGLLAAFNPCGFAMLPAYLALVVVGDGTSRGSIAAVSRALAATVMMALGFLAVFGLFGLVIAPLAGQLQRYLPFVTVVIALGLLALGGWMLAGRELRVLVPKPGRGAPNGRLWSMFGYGLAYALASLSCTIAPFLAVTGQTFRSGSAAQGVVAFLAYAGGMALVVGVLAVGVALAGDTVTTRARRMLPYVNRIGGVLLVLAALYVGYYGIYEIRVFYASADPADPVIEAAGALQRWLAMIAERVGVLPLLGVLAALVLAAVVVGRRRLNRQRKPG